MKSITIEDHNKELIEWKTIERVVLSSCGEIEGFEFTDGSRLVFRGLTDMSEIVLEG